MLILHDKKCKSMKRITLFALFAVAAIVSAHAVTRYSIAANGFASLMSQPPHIAAADTYGINGDCLVIACNTAGPGITWLDTTAIASPNYRYTARLANRHNAERKSYRVTAADGSKRIEHPIWGVTWDVTATERWELVLCCDNTAPNDDINDRRELTARVLHITASVTDTIATTVLTDDVDLYTDFNTIVVALEDDRTVVKIGRHQPNTVFDLPRILPAGPVHAGIVVGAGAEVAVERSVVKYDSNAAVDLSTLWTLDSLNEYFANSNDPMEGYWKYQDRDLDDTVMRLGGRYTLALVATDDGYDIIYIDGAQVKRSLWQTGMRKGHLTSTAFIDNYEAEWVDCNRTLIDRDVYATIESGIILAMKFPVFRSQVRFVKVLNADYNKE